MNSNKTNDAIKEYHRLKEKKRREQLTQFIQTIKDLLLDLDPLSHNKTQVDVINNFISFAKRNQTGEYVDKTTENFMIKNAMDAFVIEIDCSSGNILYVSKEIEKVIHYKQSEWINQNIQSFIHPDNWKLLKTQLQPTSIGIEEKYEKDVTQNLHTFKRGFQFMLKLKNNNFIKMNAYGKIVEKENNKFTFIGLINCYKYVELLKDAPQQFVTKLDKDGNVKIVDIGVLSLLGYTVDEMQGKPLSLFLQNKEAMQIICADKSNETKKQTHLQFFHKNTGQIVLFETEFFPFINIFNKDVDSYVCTHKIIYN